jgi:hypothetical protein
VVTGFLAGVYPREDGDGNDIKKGARMTEKAVMLNELIV